MNPFIRFGYSSFFLAVGLGSSAQAQVVTQIQTDAVGQSSWAFGGRWSDGLAPSPDKDYVNNVSGQLLRSPNNGGSTDFQGGSLTIANGATLIHKGSNNTTITIPDLRLEGGGAVSVVDSGRTLTVAGDLMTIGTGGGVFSVTQNLGTTMVIASTVSGSEPLSKTNAGTVRLDGDFSGYTGVFSVNAGGARFNSAFGGSVVATAASTISGEATLSGNLTLEGGSLIVNGATPASLGTLGDLTLSGLTLVNLIEGFPTSSAPFPILNYAGTLSGSAANFALSGEANYRNPVISTDTANVVTLAVGSEELTWTGANGTLWDVNASQNWLEGDQRYYQLDAVTFGDAGAGDVAITGVLTPSSITIDSSADYNFTATEGNLIAGPGSLTKSGSGTATIAGANTFSGGITVAAGTLRGGSFSQSFGANGQLITVASGATLDFNDCNSANRDFQGVIAGSGVGGMGAVVNNAGSGRNFGLGSLTLAGDATIGGAVTWDVRPISAAANPASVDLAGFTLTKIGPNFINFADSILSADGVIDINQGYINFSRGQISGDGNINVASGAAIRFVNFTSGSFSKAIDLAGNAELSNSGANLTLESPITLSGDARIVLVNNTLNIAQPVTGSGGFEKSGAGTLIFLAETSYTGDTVVTEGTFSPGFATLADGSTVDISASGTLELFHGETDTVESLVIDGVTRPAGLWGRIGSIIDLGADFETDRITFNGLLNVTTGPVATPFEEWAGGFDLPEGLDGPDDDADSDGLTNLQEFAFDGNPQSGAGVGKGAVKIAPVGGIPALTLTLPVRDAVGTFGGPDAISATGDGITYRIEGSAGLASWALEISEVTGADATAIQAGLPDLNPDWTYRTFRTPGTVSETTREFIRAVVE